MERFVFFVNILVPIEEIAPIRRVSTLAAGVSEDGIEQAINAVMSIMHSESVKRKFIEFIRSFLCRTMSASE